jgi:hypothetical protein
MKLIRSAAAPAAALALGVLAATVIPAASATPSPSAGTAATIATHQLHVRATTRQFALVDPGHDGPGVGDLLVESDDLTIGGKPSGESGSTCSFVAAVPGSSLTCNSIVTLSLPAGQLTLQGLFTGPFGPPTTPLALSYAVTGGTGAYTAAQGTADVIDNPGGVETYDITLVRGHGRH